MSNSFLFIPILNTCFQGFPPRTCSFVSLLFISIGEFCFRHSRDIEIKVVFMQKGSLKTFKVVVQTKDIVVEN